MVHPEAGETGVHLGGQGGRTPVPVHGFRGEVVDDEPTLGRQHHPVKQGTVTGATGGAEGFADEPFIVPVAVDEGGVDQLRARLDRVPDHPDRLPVIAGTFGVSPAHPHAAQSERADGPSGRSQFACSGHATHPLQYQVSDTVSRISYLTQYSHLPQSERIRR